MTLLTTIHLSWTASKAKDLALYRVSWTAQDHDEQAIVIAPVLNRLTLSVELSLGVHYAFHVQAVNIAGTVGPKQTVGAAYVVG